VANGKPYFSGAITETLLEDYVRVLNQQGLSDTFDLLTPREKEVLQLLAEGKTNKDVATILDVSPYTVESHRTNLMQKLNIHNTAEIVLYAVRKRLVS
jgi:RNA polymerase sigma factor (sigma-70 family)